MAGAMDTGDVVRHEVDRVKSNRRIQVELKRYGIVGRGMGAPYRVSICWR